MKCPKCGFVSYPGLAQCKKCGHRFVPDAQENSSSLFTHLFPDSPPPSQEVTLGDEPSPSPSADDAGAAPADEFESDEAERVAPPAERPAAAAQAARPPQAWQEELAEKVESFRRRRARLQQGADSDAPLELNFEPEPQGASDAGPPSLEERNSTLPDEDSRALAAEDPKVLEFPQVDAQFDVEFGTPSRAESELPVLEASPLEKSGGPSRMLSSAAAQAGDLSFAGPPAYAEREPMEIVVGALEPAEQPPRYEASTLVLTLAPLSRRFMAGLLDALVLLMGAGLFALIFWRAGGHLRPEPLNLAVLGFIVVFFTMVYFGLFTALTSSTPGLLWMDCEVRNLEGAHPTAQESFLRAFGYIVSISAVMLGFVWALLDSEGLTWHDRMSGTFVSVTAPKPRALNSEF